MKKLKSLKLMMLSALVVLGTMSASAQALKGTTQYDTDGFKYKILSCEDATEGSTVEVSQNVYSTQGAAALTIKDEVSLYVKGTNDKKEEIDKNVTFKVTSIAANGFENVKAGKDGNVTAIVIGANIAEIGDGAFDGCTNVTSITFKANENDMTIGDYAFRGTKPTKLDLTPIAGTLVANKWFGDFVSGTATNSSLTEIKFNAKLTKIVAEAFAGFTGLEKKTSIVFPETGLTGSTYLDIEAGAFKETPIEELDLTEARIQNLNRLFEYNNVTLKKVDMAKTVVTLEENALADCIQLAEVDFSKSTKLTTLKAGSLSNTIVDTYDFSKCYTPTISGGKVTGYSTFLNFATGENPFVNATTKTNKNLTTVILPYDGTADATKYSPVTEIATVFANCEKLTTITHLDVSKITTVGNLAFEKDINLESLVFPASLTTLSTTTTDEEVFRGCVKLATLEFKGNTTLGNGALSLFDTEAAGALKTLKITVEAVEEGAAKNTSSASIKAAALSNCTALNAIELASAGIWGGTIEASAVKLAEEANATITIGDVDGATFNTIDGPKGVNTTALTMGAYTSATLTTAPIVDGVVSKATINGEVTATDILDAVGQATEIEFKGEIKAATLGVPAKANAVLTTLNFNDIKMAAGTIVKTTFDETNAPLLAQVTWQPDDADATAAFAKEAFGSSSVGAAAKVTLITTTAVGDGKYELKEANLFNVIFKAEAGDKTVPVPITALGKDEKSGFYYGKVYVPAGKKYAFKKETAKDKGDIVVYSAFVDSKDQKIYMDPLAIVDGEYVAYEKNVVIVRVKDPQTVTAREKGGFEFVSNAICEETDHGSTMRGLYIGGKWQVYNHLQMTTKVFSSDYIGTTYVGKTLYAMGNPATEGKLLWKKIDVKSYLPKDAVFVETEEQPASASELEVVWLDGTENVTGIIERLSDEQSNENGAVYNLQGVRVSNAQKGIYIKNGKKFIVK